MSVDLTEIEIFQVIEEWADAAVERAFSTGLEALPSRQHESQTALKIRLAIAERKIAKYEARITELLELNRQAGLELSRNLLKGYGFVQLPHVTRRRIQELGMEIQEIKEEAKRFAMRFGWCLVGGIEPESGVYRFQKLPLRHALGRRAG